MIPNRPAQNSDQPISVLIIGSGFAGLGMAIQLQKAGIQDFQIVEKGEDVGGTWRENHYPGCACDVQSHLYSFSFEPNPGWSRMFSPQPEIWDYLRGCARKYELLPKISMNTQVVSAVFDEAAGLWQVQVADGAAMTHYLRSKGLHLGDALDITDPELPPRRTLTTHVLVSAMGGLSVPAYPSIKGLESFTGKSFHSQDWDHQYDFKNKRVAVIGTGASAIQFVPQIQPQVAKLDLYQRTPPWLMPKLDWKMSRLEKWLFRRLPLVQRLYRYVIYGLREFTVLAFAVHPRLMKLPERAARGHIRRQIRNPELREKVTPKFTFGCKRVLLSNDYYPALDQPNVDVITTGIREVRANSIVTTDGIERPLDAIIFGTGFKVSDPLPRGAIIGRNGVDMLDAWKDGPEAYKGTTVAGFPNLFMLVGPNVGLGHSSMIYMIESQVRYVMDALRVMRENGGKFVDVKPTALAEYNARLQEKHKTAIWNVGGCTSWYRHPNGKNVALWPGFTWQFRRATRRFDAEVYNLEPLQNAVGTQAFVSKNADASSA